MKANFLLALAGLLTVNVANALPTIYPSDENQILLFKISNSTDSNLVADNINVKKVYVMPPNSAKAMVSKNLFLRTANLGFCKEMGDLQGYSRNTAKDIGDYEKRLDGKKKEVDAIRAKLSEARQKSADYATVNNMIELQDLDLRIATLDQLIKDRNETLRACSSECDTVKKEIQSNLDESSTLSQRRRALARQYSASLIQYEKFKKLVEGYEEDLRVANRSWNQMDEDLASIKGTLIKMYKDLGSLEAARSSIIFKSKWDSNVEELRRNNPEFEFEKIQTESAVFTTDLVDLANVPSGGAIMGYQLSSCKNSDSTHKCETSSYPESISGNVVLSTIGACPIEHPEYFDLDPKTPNTPDQMSYGLTVAYEYPAAMSVSAVAKYNMHKMYEKITSMGKSGGFFRSRSWTSVQERTEFKDSFTVDWTEQDAKVALPEAKKVAIEQEMRNSAFARLAKIGLPAISNPGDLVAPNAPKTGALVLADELKNNASCRTNIYCTSASIALSVLDAIFGNSSSSASYTNIQDADLYERWSTTSVVMKPYVTTYTKK